MSVALEVIVSGLIVLGSLAALVAAVGLVRMPDLFTRMQASSKAATLGAILILLAAAIFFADPALGVRALLIAVFLALTTPVGAHVIARAGYRDGIRMADPGAHDELEGRYAEGEAGPLGDSDSVGTPPVDDDPGAIDAEEGPSF